MEAMPKPLRAVQAFRRFVLRLIERSLWHVRGVLLWLLRRPQLRFVPLPYPNVLTVEQWKLQAESMTRSRALPKRHVEKALGNGAFNNGNLRDAAWLRKRLGLRQSFLEDPMVVGMLAAQTRPGLREAWNRQLRTEMEAEAKASIEARGKTAAVRELIGPKGGLPTLKGDLVKLAVLLIIQMPDKITVTELKEKIRPVLDTIKGDVAKVPHETSATPTPKAIAPGRPAQPVKAVSASTSTATMTVSEVHGLLQQQDRKLHSMLQGLMMQISHLQPQTLDPPIHFQMDEGNWDCVEQPDEEMNALVQPHGWTADEIHQLNAEAWDEGAPSS